MENIIEGNVNTFPSNWKPATEDEFWNRFMTYSPVKQEYRQMLKFADGTKSDKMVIAKLFLYSDGIGLAMVRKVVRARQVTPDLYKFAVCEHINKIPVPEKSANCYHVSRCTDCNREFSVDSSD